MKVVISTQGSLGDLLPYLGIGAELRRRGHSVAVAAPRQMGGRIEEGGLEFRPARPHVTLDEPRLIQLLHAQNRNGLERFMAEVVAPALPGHLADTEAALTDADIVVTHPMSLGAAITAELRGLPRVATVLSPWLFVSAHEPARFAGYPTASWLYTHAPRLRPVLRKAVIARARRSAEPIIAVRRGLGLPTQPNPLYDGVFAGERVLGLFSSLLATPRPDWPPNTVITGFCTTPSTSAELPPALAEFLDRGPAPAVFTLGSSYVQDPGDFYLESLAAARKCGLRSVLLATTGVPTDLGTDVCVVPFADHRALFPRAAVVVCSAGIGTLAAVMASGRPFVAVPDGVDQPDNAYRCQRLGLAQTIPRHRYHARRLASALNAALNDPAFPARSADVTRHLAGEPGVAAACTAIEEAARRVTD